MKRDMDRPMAVKTRDPHRGIRKDADGVSYNAVRADQYLSLGFRAGRDVGRRDAERELAAALDALRDEMHEQSERMTARLLDEIRTLRSHLAETRMELHRRNMLDLAEHSERDLSAKLN